MGCFELLYPVTAGGDGRHDTVHFLENFPADSVDVVGNDT